MLASQLHSTELANWVSQELDGYKSEEELPDYRIVHTGCLGAWTNGAWLVKNRGVPISRITNDKLKEFLTKFRVAHGIRTVEQHAVTTDSQFAVPQISLLG